MFGEETEWQVASNTVFHDCLRPSHLLLPVFPLIAGRLHRAVRRRLLAWGSRLVIERTEEFHG